MFQSAMEMDILKVFSLYFKRSYGKGYNILPCNSESNFQHTTYTKSINNFPKVSVMQNTDKCYCCFQFLRLFRLIA